jgi:GntR family transcriptional repressor for pyruvate dehydrogenase complex
MPFKKLKSERKSAHVINQILEAIKSGELKPGERLPTESKLAELTGVSRSSVREALSALRLVGIVETHAGDGTYLREFKDVEGIKTELLAILTENKRTLQLQEARAAFECGIMKLAAENIDTEDINDFKKILTQMRNAAKLSHYDEFIDLHKQFHLAIAKSTKNVIIEEIIANFTSIMNEQMWKDLEKSHYLPNALEPLRESLEIHEGIFQALERKDSDLATKRMEEHFERYR